MAGLPTNIILAQTRDARQLIQHGAMAIAHKLQRETGIRVSELLDIRRGDILDDHQLWIRGTKGSYDRLISAPYVVDYFRRVAPAKKDARLFTFTYRQFYTFVLRRNSFDKKPGAKNKRVTHYARSQFFKRLAAHVGSLNKSISVAGGHRSQRSTYYYLDQKPPKYPQNKKGA
jgi:integrase